jgi:16S rRNA (cytidine1402-2'-O)-methyltransferase
VCRELTKVYEEIFRGTVGEAIAHFAEPRGEFTLVVEGRLKEESKVSTDTVEQLRRLRDEGLPAKEAVARVARESGIPKREVYRAWLSLG